MADPRLSDHVNLKEALRSFSQESRAVMLDDADVSRLFGRALERVIELEAEVAQSSLNEKEYLERIAELDRENFALRMETMSDLVERLEGGARNMGVNRATLREAAQAIKGWETFAAVKQQRIEELEVERDRLQMDNEDWRRRYDAMKMCAVAHEERVSELEQQNIELHSAAASKDGLAVLADQKIEQLERENSEMKADLEKAMWQHPDGELTTLPPSARLTRSWEDGR